MQLRLDLYLLPLKGTDRLSLLSETMIEGVQISLSLHNLKLHILGIFLALPCEEVQQLLRLVKASMKYVACLSNPLSLLRLISRL